MFRFSFSYRKNELTNIKFLVTYFVPMLNVLIHKQ
jgi:hypothetical protein